MNMYKFKILDTCNNNIRTVYILARTWQDARGQIKLKNFEIVLDN